MNCVHWDIPDIYKVIFVNYILSPQSDARQYFDAGVMKAKSDGLRMKWKHLCDLIAARYASATKQMEISKRLDSLKIDDVREMNDDNCAV